LPWTAAPEDWLALAELVVVPVALVVVAVPLKVVVSTMVDCDCDTSAGTDDDDEAGTVDEPLTMTVEVDSAVLLVTSMVWMVTPLVLTGTLEEKGTGAPTRVLEDCTTTTTVVDLLGLTCVSEALWKDGAGRLVPEGGRNTWDTVVVGRTSVGEETTCADAAAARARATSSLKGPIVFG
jgi:hypothetical protein